MNAWLGIDGQLVGWLVSGLAVVVVLAWACRSRSRMDLLADRLETLLDTIPDGIYETRFDGTLLIANDPLARLLGFPDAHGMLAAVDNVVELWLHPARRAELVSAIEAGVHRGSLEVELVRRDGTTLVAELSFQVVTDVEGRPVGLRGIVRDLSEVRALQQRADEADAVERRLDRTEEILAAFMDNVPAAVYVADTDGRFVMLNAECERIMGLRAADVLGRTRAEIQEFGPTASSMHRRNDLEVLRTGAAQTWEEHFGSGPQRRTFVSVKFPLLDRHGAPFGVGGVSTDITELERLRSEADRAWAETAHRLAVAVEYRDEETGAHVARVAAYCELIATHLHDPAVSPAQLRAAAPLHDAGKIAIADHILLKPGTLTASERAVMEAHTIIGHQLLTGTGSATLDLAASIALTHHERYDGSGYPNRLRGDEIPIEGRIAAIADVFDALTCDRVYRRAMPIEAAIATMLDESGAAFDPRLLELFLDHLDEARAILRRHADDGPELAGRSASYA